MSQSWLGGPVTSDWSLGCCRSSLYRVFCFLKPREAFQSSGLGCSHVCLDASGILHSALSGPWEPSYILLRILPIHQEGLITTIAVLASQKVSVISKVEPVISLAPDPHP